MKLLFITYHYLNGNGGGVFASRAYINAFAELSDEMTLLCPMKDGAAPEHINPKVKTIPVWDRRGKVRKFFDLCIGRFNRFLYIEQYIGENHYDVVVFDTCMVTRGLIRMFKQQGSKVITIHHNYQYEYFRDNEKHPTRWPTLFWTNIQEREAIRCSDLNLTLTQADKQLLAAHYGDGKENIQVLGTFEYKRKEHKVLPEVTEPHFLITGNLGAVQSEKSLLPWMDEYYPILKDVFSNATLTLAGHSPSERLMEKARHHEIKVIPSPDSMLPILAKAKYYICATSLGGGLKLRVMDGLQAGLLVVCHAVSARGYEAFVKKGLLLVYDDKKSFRTQIEKLKKMQVNKIDIIAAYEEIFSFENGKKRLREILEKEFTENVFV